MRFFKIAPLLVGLLYPAVASAAPSADKANDFDFAVYGRLKAEKGNVFFSAPSLRDALGIAYLGARGATKDEMSKALSFEPDLVKAAADAQEGIQGWNAARGSASLSIANRLWTDKTNTTLLPAFLSRSTDAYGAAAQPIDFAGAPGASRLTINQWVAKQTNDRIQDLLPEPAVTDKTRVVITNAVWFKGTWGTKFEKSDTRPEAFLVDGTNSRDVPTMHRTATYALSAGDGARVLEMPYAKSDLAMDIILPDAPNGLPAIEAKLTRGTFTTWSSHLTQREVELSLPKFTIAWGGSMIPHLSALGMQSAFDRSRADFTGLATDKDPNGRLFVSTVFHKAFVAVDEEGTEAAAATAVGISVATTSVHPPPVAFKVDRPFVFLIRDVKRGGILFMGRVNNPAS